MYSPELMVLSEKLKNSDSILCREDYFSSAVLIPFMIDEGVLSLLFEKRSAGIRQGGEICFPGGEYDLGEDKSSQDAAIRETVEETGISREYIKIIGKLPVMLAPMGVIIEAYPAFLEIEDIKTLDFNKEEVEELFCIPLDYFIANEPEVYYLISELSPYYINAEGRKVDTLPVEDLELPLKYMKKRRGKDARVFLYNTSEGPLWGITARLVYETVKIIKGNGIAEFKK